MPRVKRRSRAADVLAHGSEILGGRRAAVGIDVARAAQHQPRAVGIWAVELPVDDSHLPRPGPGRVPFSTMATSAPFHRTVLPAQRSPSWVMRTTAVPDARQRLRSRSRPARWQPCALDAWSAGRRSDREECGNARSGDRSGRRRCAEDTAPRAGLDATSVDVATRARTSPATFSTDSGKVASLRGLALRRARKLRRAHVSLSSA